MLDFIVGGAQKAATTWLYLCLRDHAELEVPAKKMEWRYCGGDWQNEYGLDALSREFGFAKRAGLRGHVSVQYLADARCADALKELSPDCRIIFVLREPIERLVSAYYWYWRKNEVELELNEAVRLAFLEEDSVDAVERPVQRDLLDRGQYARQIRRYLENFSPEQILLLSFDEIQKDRKAVWVQVQEFLGCDAAQEVAHTSSSPKKNSGLSWLMAMERKFPQSLLVGHVANTLHQFFDRAGFKGEKRALSPENRAALESLYKAPLMELLSSEFGGVVGASEVQQSVNKWLSQYG